MNGLQYKKMKKDNICVRWITHQRSSRVCSIEHFVSWLIELASRDSRYSKIDLIADVQRNYFYLIILTPFSIKTYPLMQTESPSFIYVMCPKKQITWSKEEKMSLFFRKMNLASNEYNTFWEISLDLPILLSTWA